MADDLDDAERVVADQGGIENHPYGLALARIVRQIRMIRNALKALDDRLKALEGP